MNIVSREEALPLTPHAFYVLTALADHPMSAYDLYEQCTIDSEQAFTFNRRNLYRTVKNLLKWTFVVVKGQYPSYGSNSQRTVYQISDTGRLILDQETARYRQAASLATARLKLLERRTKTATLAI